MPPLIAARGQMAVSLGFHIVWAAIGVGLPLMMFIAEGFGLFTKNVTWYILAKRWAKAFGIQYAIGAVSGTVLSFELGLLWPRFMHFAGPIFGIAFFIEATAFFIEAIFLGLYLYSWEKVRPVVHWLFCLPLLVGGLASSLFVVTANAWMNTPVGFRIVGGKVVDINPIQAIMSPSAPTEAFHMTLAAYEATAFGAAAIYAFAMLRGTRDDYVRKGLLLSMTLGILTAPLQVWIGDVSAKIVAETQPAKLAAMEGLFHTQTHAPLTIYGWPDPGTSYNYFSIKIDSLLSLLAYDDWSHPVKGLDAFPGILRPDPRIIHPLFDTMVGIGFLIAFLSLWFWFRYFRGGWVIPQGRWTLWGVVAAGPLAFLAIEFGWSVTELGRQPWIIYGYMFVKDGVTTAPGLDASFPIFFILYILLGIASVVFLVRLGREERGSPSPRVKIGEIVAAEDGGQVEVTGG